LTEIGPAQLAFLCVATLFAGAMDAIAGGGGIITVPALTLAGLPPHLVLGTNKGQSVLGSLSALARFGQAGWVDRGRAPGAFALGFAGSLGGAALVLLVQPQVLRPLIAVLLVAVGLFLALRRMPTPSAEASADPGRRRAAGLACLVIGTYDGFFGPGTGTFLITAFVGILGEPVARASANAKVVNFASNLAAMILFAHRGTVVWRIALPMAAAQFVGGWIGAHVAVRNGDALVRRVAVGVVTVLVAKLAWDMVTVDS